MRHATFRQSPLEHSHLGRSLLGHSCSGSFRLAKSVACAVLLLSGLPSAYAHEYTAQIDAKRFTEVDTALRAKLASEPNNAAALVGSIDVILARGDVKRFDHAIKLAEQCIQHNPDSSICHESLGNVLGSKAEKGGDLMGAMGSIGTIRDSFKKAIALDPTNYQATVSLVQFYLEVPGLMGGSASSAKKLIRKTHETNPEVAKLLQAHFDLYDEEFEQARLGAMAVNTDNNAGMVKLQRDVLIKIGLVMNREKRFSDAEAVFSAVIERYPDAAQAYFGLGRSLLEQGKPQDALSALQQSLALEASAAAHYRLGQTWQALGDSAKAVSSFEQALAFIPELSSKARKDAQARLEALTGAGFSAK